MGWFLWAGSCCRQGPRCFYNQAYSPSATSSRRRLTRRTSGGPQLCPPQRRQGPRMNLDRALQYNTAALAVLGALFLGLGHESVVLPVVLTLAAIVSVGLSERFRWMRINRILANVFALAAVC